MADLIQTEMLKEQLKSKHSTNHILHLILSLCTGIWFIGWIAVAIMNSRKRDAIDEKFTSMQIAAKENQ
jgi:preprotein translocase subunit SecG